MKQKIWIFILLILSTIFTQAGSINLSQSTITLGESTTLKAEGYSANDSFIWKVGRTYQEVFSDEGLFYFQPNIAGQHHVELFVNGRSEENITIEVTSNGVVGHIEAGQDQTICLGDYAELQAVAPTNSKLEWKIADDKYADGATFYFNPNAVGLYTIDLLSNNEQDSLVVTVNSCGGTNKPTAVAGDDQNATIGATIQLKGDTSSDPDNNPLSYLWSFSHKPSGSSATLSDLTVANPTFTADLNGTYTLQLIVNNGQEDSVADSVEITVIEHSSLQQPIAAATVDNSNITEGMTVTFDANSSYDPDGVILSYEWSENGVILSNDAIFSINTLTIGQHTILLTVMDDDGLIGRENVVVTVQTLTNQGISFHTAFTSNINEPNKLSLFISATEDTTGEIKLYDTNETINFSVSAGTSEEVIIPKRMMLSGTTIEKKVIEITSEKDIVVVGLNQLDFTTDAFLILPDRVLSTEYYALTYGNNITNNYGQEEFAIVATQDNTVVNIELPNGLGIIDINLSKGETYQYQKTTTGNWLTGTHISSNKKIALLGGNSCTNIPQDQAVIACDYVVEQILPINTWENEFITVPLKTRSNGDTFRVLASQDNTEVKLNGTVVSTLNAGEYYETILENSNHIIANNPILVAQYSNSTSYDNVTSDPFMTLVPAINQFDNQHIINTPTGFTDYMNIVVHKEGIYDVELDGINIDSNQFTLVNGTDYASAQIQISAGEHTINSDKKIGISGYGFASFDSYAYPSSLRLIQH